MYKVWRLEMQVGSCVYHFWTITLEGTEIIWEWYAASCFT